MILERRLLRNLSIYILFISIVLIGYTGCEKSTDVTPKKPFCNCYTTLDSSKFFLDTLEIGLNSLTYRRRGQIDSISICEVDYDWNCDCCTALDTSILGISQPDSADVFTATFTPTEVALSIGSHSSTFISSPPGLLITGAGNLSINEGLRPSNNLYLLNISSEDWLVNTTSNLSTSGLWLNVGNNLSGESVYAANDLSVYYYGGGKMVKFDLAENVFEEIEITGTAHSVPISDLNISANNQFLFSIPANCNGLCIRQFDIQNQLWTNIYEDTTRFFISPSTALIENDSKLAFMGYDWFGGNLSFFTINLTTGDREILSTFIPDFITTGYERDIKIVSDAEEDHIYVLGATQVHGQSIWRFNLNNKTWKMVATLDPDQAPKQGHLELDPINRKLYLSFENNRVFRYNIDNEYITEISPIPTN